MILGSIVVLDYSIRLHYTTLQHTTMIIMSLETIRAYFNTWRRAVDARRYDTWCDEHDEELAEAQFAMQNNMDSVHWCWNCKYSDCDVH